jgi:hypothetical protein
MMRPAAGREQPLPQINPLWAWAPHQTISEKRQEAPMECRERDRLIETAENAAEAVCATLVGDRMRRDFVPEIRAARAAEREAAVALAEHRRDHNC